jgi:hypothetical protein
MKFSLPQSQNIAIHPLDILFGVSIFSHQRKFKMKHLIILITSIILSFSVYAQIDTSQLTPAQVSALQAAANEMSGSSVKNISAGTREELTAWGQLGQDLGKGLVSAAKEVGVAASEFSQTPLGKIVTFILVFKLIGADILGVLIGIPIMIAGIYFGVKIMNTPKDIKYEHVDRAYFWGMFTIRQKYVKEKIMHHDQSDYQVAGLLVIAIALVVSLFTIFA